MAFKLKGIDTLIDPQQEIKRRYQKKLFRIGFELNQEIEANQKLISTWKALVIYYGTKMDAFRNLVTHAAIPTNYTVAMSQLVARRCPTCAGSGECDDAEPGDIGYNKWVCTDCYGSGFKQE